MTSSTFANQEAAAAIVALRSALRGAVLTASDPAYDGARRIWNGAVDRRPAAIVRCADEEDVAAAVRLAREHDLPLSVLGGGHDWGGRALRDGGVVIDLSAMRRVRVDPGTATAVAWGGARAGDVVAATHPHGLAPVTGLVKAVGMAGLTLAGGYGLLIGAHGLALDNLLSARVVLADGRAVTASAEDNPDLYWALRGGGGNFGVVTSMRYRVHPVDSVLSGLVLFPLTQGRTVLRGYRELIAEAPDDLTVMAGFFGGPDGRPLLFLLPAWVGDHARGEAIVNRLRRLGTPVTGQIGRIAYQDILGQFDPSVVNGRHTEIRTRWLPELTEETASLLVTAMTRVTSPHSAVFIHHFHGAASRVPAGGTAFALRRDHVLVEIVASWDTPSGGNAAHGRWARALSDGLAKTALPGGYPNLLGVDEHERALRSYGGNLPRLLELKRNFDPDDVFTAVPALHPAMAENLTK
ncbi:MAG TPA: FAD-binding oxidoreductase [Streptosporangiaceae bacterium]|nr:FAD-binding oxidoreductase [Streptosporangiaceae bacterium]